MVNTRAEVAAEFKDKVLLFNEKRTPPFAKFVLRAPTWAAAVLVDAISVGPSSGAVIQISGLRGKYENIFIYSAGEYFYYEFQSVFLGHIAKNTNPRQANHTRRLAPGFVLKFGALSLRFEAGPAPLVAPPSPMTQNPARPRLAASDAAQDPPGAKRQPRQSQVSVPQLSPIDLPPGGIQPPVQPIGLPPSLQRRSERSELAWNSRQTETGSGLTGSSSTAAERTTEHAEQAAALTEPGAGSGDGAAPHTSTDATQESQASAEQPAQSSQSSQTGQGAQSGQSGHSGTPLTPEPENATVLAQEQEGASTAPGKTRRRQPSSASEPASQAGDAAKPAKERRQRKARPLFVSDGDGESTIDEAPSERNVRALIRQEKAQRRQREKEREEAESENEPEDEPQHPQPREEVGPEQEDPVHGPQVQNGAGKNGRAEGHAENHAENHAQAYAQEGAEKDGPEKEGPAHEPPEREQAHVASTPKRRRTAKQTTHATHEPRASATPSMPEPAEASATQAAVRGELHGALQSMQSTLVSELRQALAADAQANADAQKAMFAEVRAGFSGIQADVAQVRDQVRDLREYVDATVLTVTNRMNRAVRLAASLNESCNQQLSVTVEGAIQDMASTVNERLGRTTRMMNNNLASTVRQMQVILGNDTGLLDEEEPAQSEARPEARTQARPETQPA